MSTTKTVTFCTGTGATVLVTVPVPTSALAALKTAVEDAWSGTGPMTYVVPGTPERNINLGAIVQYLVA